MTLCLADWHMYSSKLYTSSCANPRGEVPGYYLPPSGPVGILGLSNLVRCTAAVPRRDYSGEVGHSSGPSILAPYWE